MSSLSFVLVQPGKRATAASKHQARAGIHSHAQKITQQRKRERRLHELGLKSKTTCAERTPSAKETPNPKGAGVSDEHAFLDIVSIGSRQSHWGLPTPSPEPDFDRPLTTYSSWRDDHKYGIGMFLHVTIIDINEINTNMAFWSQVVPTYSETFVCVRDVASAIASANQAIQNRDDSLFLIALDLHLKAIGSLRRDLMSLPLSAQIACCLLFEAFSVLRCDFGSAGKQIDTAKMLASTVQVDTWMKDDMLATVCEALTKMSQTPAWSLWNPSNFLRYEGLRYAEPNLYLGLEAIDTTNGILQGLVDSMQRTSRQFSGRIRRNLSELAFLDPSSQLAQDVLREMRTWKSLFDKHVAQDVIGHGPTVQQAELGWHFTYLTFDSGVLNHGELIHDNPEYLPHYSRINDLAEQRFDESGDYSRHSTIKAFLQIIIPSLWLIILMCRDPHVRGRAIRILKSRHYEESDFNSIVAGHLADHIVDLETQSRLVQTAHDIPLQDRIRVEGLRYLADTKQVVLTYSFADQIQRDMPLHEKHIPWKVEGDLVRFNSAIGALSQTCTLYRKVRPSSAPLGYIKPMYYKGELVPVRIGASGT